MRILGIESSSLVASAAIYEDGITMAEYTVDFKMTHSQTLLPMIDEMVKLVGSRSEYDRRHRSIRRSGILYGSQNRICDGEGTWIGIK